MQFLESKKYYINVTKNYYFSKFQLKKKVFFLKKINLLFMFSNKISQLKKKIIFIIAIFLTSKFPIFLKKKFKFKITNLKFLTLKLKISLFFFYTINLLYLPIFENLKISKLNNKNNFFFFKMSELPFLDQFFFLGIFNLIFYFLNYTKLIFFFKTNISNWYINESFLRSFFFLIIMKKRKSHLIKFLKKL